MTEKPVPHIRRDAYGKIVEFDAAGRVPFKLAPQEPQSLPVEAEPTTLAEAHNMHNRRMRLVEESYTKARQLKSVEASRKVSPAIAERDKLTLAARRKLDEQKRALDLEEQREIARVTREVRARCREARVLADAAYIEARDAAYAAANAVARAAERELAEYAAELDARTKRDLGELVAILKDREAKIREKEKAAAEAVAAPP